MNNNYSEAQAIDRLVKEIQKTGRQTIYVGNGKK